MGVWVCGWESVCGVWVGEVSLLVVRERERERERGCVCVWCGCERVAELSER